MTNRPRAISLGLALLAASAVACTSGAPSQVPWSLYAAGPLPTPDPTLAPTPAPVPTASPLAEATLPPLDCPSALPTSPMRLHDLLAIDPLCFGTASISLIGWQAQPGEFDWEGPTVEPGWLIYPSAAGRSALWEGKPDRLGACNGFDPCPWSTVSIPAGSAVTFNSTGNWVKVTGHVNDAAAAECHYVYDPVTSQSERLPDSDAQHWCASAFVLEQVEVVRAP
jgi:hypothetical protein